MLEERMTAESNKLAAEGPKFLAEAAKEVISIVKHCSCMQLHAWVHTVSCTKL
jgi:hypothetical protein